MQRSDFRTFILLFFSVQFLSLTVAAQFEQKAELYVEAGHTNRIDFAVFSPDGKKIASASSQDKSIKIWDAATGRELQTLKCNCDFIIFAPDSETLISKESYSGKIRSWNIFTGDETRTIVETLSSVYGAALSPDGKTLATGDLNGIVKFWDFRSGKEIKTFKAHNEAISSLVFSPDGKIFASAGDDKIVKLWDAASGKELKTLKGHTEQVKSIVFSPDNRTLASQPFSTFSDKIKIWDAASGKLLKTLDGEDSPVESVFFSPKGQTLGVRDGLYGVEIWDVSAGSKIRDITDSYSHGIKSFAFSPDGETLAISDAQTIRLFNVNSGLEIKNQTQKSVDTGLFALAPDLKTLVLGNSSSLQIWNIAAGEKLKTFDRYPAFRRAIAVSGDGKIVAAGGFDKDAIKLFDFASGQELKALVGHAGRIRAVDFSADGTMLASASEDKTVKLWDVVSGKETKTLKGHTKPVNSVSFAPDGKTLASVSEDSTVKLWTVADGQEIKSLKKYLELDSIAFSPDGKKVVFGSGNLAWLWDFNSSDEPKIYRGYATGVRSIKFSDDNSIIVARDWDETVKFWNLASGEEIKSIVLPTAAAQAIAFSPNGNLTAVVEKEAKVIRLLETASNKEIRTLAGHSEPVKSIVFSPDGKSLASTGGDKTVRLWNAETGDAIKIFTGTAPYFYSPTFSADGKTLAACEAQNSNNEFQNLIKLWDVATGREIKTLKIKNAAAEISGIGVIALSPDGKKLAFADPLGGFLRLWDAESDRELLTFKGSDVSQSLLDTPSAVVFSPNGKILATGGRNADIELWDVAAGEKLKSINIPTPRIRGEIFDAAADFYLKSRTTPTTPDGKYQFRNDEAGRINVYEIKTNRLLASLIAFDENDWLIVTPEGRFDTNKSLDRIEGLHWIVNNEILKPLPLDVFMRQYYEPNLMQRILAGEQFKSLPSIANINRVQPKVAFKEIKFSNNSADADSVDVTIEVENVKDDISISAADKTKKRQLSSGAYDLRLFRDGQLVGVSAPKDKLAAFINNAPRLIAETKAAGKLIDTPEDRAWREANDIFKIKTENVEFVSPNKAEYTFRNVKLPRDGRKTIEFTAYAFNADKVKSRTTAPFNFKVPEAIAAAPKKGRAFVVSIGVNASENKAYNLRYAANDARKMQEIIGGRLTADNSKYSEIVQIPLVSDYGADERAKPNENNAQKAIIKSVFALLEGKSLQDVSKENPKLSDALKNIPNVEKIKAVEPEDTLIITYAGHGYADDAGIFYLLPYDIGADTRELTAANLGKMISSDELSLWMQNITAAEMIMIIDACHSSAAVQGDGFKPGPMGSRGLGQLAYDKDMKILSATQANNVALELNSLEQGLLSYALLQDGVKDGLADAPPRDKQLFAAEWLSFAEKRVPELYTEVRDGKRGVILNGEKLTPDKTRSKFGGVTDAPNSALNLQQPSLFDFKRRTIKNSLFALQ